MYLFATYYFYKFKIYLKSIVYKYFAKLGQQTKKQQFMIEKKTLSKTSENLWCAKYQSWLKNVNLVGGFVAIFYFPIYWE